MKTIANTKTTSRPWLSCALFFCAAPATLGCASSSSAGETSSTHAGADEGGADSGALLHSDSGSELNDSGSFFEAGVPACGVDAGTAGAGAKSGVIALGPGTIGTITQSLV